MAPQLIYGKPALPKSYDVWLSRCRDLLSYHLGRPALMYAYRELPWKGWFNDGWDVPSAVHECMLVRGINKKSREARRRRDHV